MNSAVNENKMTAGNRRAAKSRLSKQMTLRCISAMAVYAAAVVIAAVIAGMICRIVTWQPHDILYRILDFAEDNIVLFCGTVIAAGWLVIFALYVQKLLGFLDEMTEEASKLVFLESGQIRLSPELADFQNDLNAVRENAIRLDSAAREAEQRKNDLIVYLAHDLKTPLTSVIGYLSLMKDEQQISGELRAKYTGIALDKAERLEELINEFFDITRFNLTQIPLELETVNFTRLTMQTASEFDPILEEKGLTWKLNISDGVELLCDADKMERVLDNIIRNAVSYSYPDTEIALELYKTERSVVFNVSNKGKTISKEKLDKIFEQFFRLDASRGTGTGGSGLGLAIAKEITELHGGKITAESANESIKFTVEIPM